MAVCCCGESVTGACCCAYGLAAYWLQPASESAASPSAIMPVVGRRNTNDTATESFAANLAGEEWRRLAPRCYRDKPAVAKRSIESETPSVCGLASTAVTSSCVGYTP